MVDSSKHQLIYSYILGQLNDREQGQFEVEYFAQPELQKAVWAVFDEITEQFLQRQLSPNAAKNFAAQLQTNPYLLARVKDTQLMLRLVGEAATANANQVIGQPHLNGGGWGSWRSWPIWQWGVAFAAFLFIGFGGFWLFWGKKQTGLEVVKVLQTPVMPLAISPEPQKAASPAPTSIPHTFRSPDHSATIKSTQSDIAKFYILRERNRAAEVVHDLAIPAQTQVINLFIEVDPAFRYAGLAKTMDGQAFKTFASLSVQRQKRLAFVLIQLNLNEIPTDTFSFEITNSQKSTDDSVTSAQTFHLINRRRE